MKIKLANRVVAVLAGPLVAMGQALEQEQALEWAIQVSECWKVVQLGSE